MSRTSQRFDSGFADEDGMVDLAAPDFFVSGGAATLTRNGKGDISWNQGVGLTDTFFCPLSTLLLRTGLQPALQEQFGAGGPSKNPFGANNVRVQTPTTQTTAIITAAGAGVPVNIAVAFSALFTVGRSVLIDLGVVQEYQVVTALPDATHITVAQCVFNHPSGVPVSQGAFTTPAPTSGIPPFTGVSQFNAQTSPPLKGMLIRGIEVRYLTSVVALTTLTVGLSQTIFKNGTALAVTDILAPVALPVGFAANPNIVPVVVNSPWLVADLAEYTLEVTVTTAATGTFRFYGMTMYITFNYN